MFEGIGRPWFFMYFRAKLYVVLNFLITELLWLFFRLLSSVSYKGINFFLVFTLVVSGS